MTTKDVKYWLEEKELKTPEHDKLVLWTFNNCFRIFEELKIALPIITHIQINEKITEGRLHGKWDNENRKYIASINYLEEKEIVEKDFLEFNNIIKVNKGLNDEKIYNFKKILEFNLAEENRWNVGFIDLKVMIHGKSIQSNTFFSALWDNDNTIEFFFEIKPEIVSIGETMRQINFYRNYAKGIFIIVTKTKGLKEIFASQDVYVYEYEEESDKSCQEKL